MIDLNLQCPEAEDIVEGINRCFANIRDNLSDIECLTKRLVSNQTFVTEEKVTEILHCDSVPDRIPYYRVGRNVLYKLSEVYSFIEERRYGGK